MKARNRGSTPARGRALLRAALALCSGIAGLVIAISLAEVALRVCQPVRPLRLEHPFVNQYVRLERPRDSVEEFMPEAGLPGVTERVRYSTNGHGFRGSELQVPKPDGEFRIFAVGGSTTECHVIDDAHTYPAVVEQELAASAGPEHTFRVYNTGVSGAASDDHVAMISQRLVHLEPDLIIVFAGINEVLRSMVPRDPLHYSAPVLRTERTLKGRLLQLRTLAILQHAVVGPSEKEVQEQMEGIYAKIALQASHPEQADHPPLDLEFYESNLRTIVGMSRAHGFGLMFMTQQTTWNSPIDPRAKEWHHLRCRDGKTYSEVHMDAAVEQLNDVMRSLANELEVPLYDLAREMPKSLDYIYDDCHFNTNGSITAGKSVARFLQEQELVPRAASAQ